MLVLIRVALPVEALGADGLLSNCTERLTPLAHSVFVLALSYTSLMTLLCHRRMLGNRTSVIILILRHRCTWCLLMAHMDAPRVGAVIRVMLNVASTEVRFQPEPAPAVCSQRTRSDDAPDPCLLLKKNRFLVSIFDQFDIDFRWGISEIRLGLLWFLIRNDPKLGQGPTLEGWCLYQTCPMGQANGTSTTYPCGTSRLGQVVLVPVGQAGCLHQACPTETRKGQKRPFLVPWDKSYDHAGGLSLSRDKFYTHDAACPSSTCPNLSYKVRLQGREKVTFRGYGVRWKVNL